MADIFTKVVGARKWVEEGISRYSYCAREDYPLLSEPHTVCYVVGCTVHKQS